MNGLSVIRYADDFVILHKDYEIILKIRKVVDLWLEDNASVKLSETKSRLTDKLEDGMAGFDFLGFHIRRYAISRFHDNKFKTGAKTLIKLSRKSMCNHMDDIAAALKPQMSAATIISTLTPTVRGWCYYFKTVTSTKTFGKLRQLMYRKFISWAKRKHPNRSMAYLYRHYFIRGKSQLQFGTTTLVRGKLERVTLKVHNQYSIRRHVKVKGDKSPYDGDTSYWGQRLRRYAGFANNDAASFTAWPM